MTDHSRRGVLALLAAAAAAPLMGKGVSGFGHQVIGLDVAAGPDATAFWKVTGDSMGVARYRQNAWAVRALAMQNEMVDEFFNGRADASLREFDGLKSVAYRG